ncbi:membrane-bound O-acyltransferase family protein [marine bacterium AO1-C]|nr:membrane-bound O-acyltransferase family protein [marine bacterium AO1-C]
MLFNSLEFAIFLPLVYTLYWLISKRGHQAQNLVLLLASYFFYAWWDWRFLGLILASSLIDYQVGLQLAKTKAPQQRKWWLYLSLSTNLGLLVFFKYFNFFIDSFAQAFSLLGVSLQPSQLTLILPVGISFYTFQTLSYTLDVYRHKIKPTNNLLSFLCFVSFFPQLVAGPIERASHLLPQFHQNRVFNYAQTIDGLRQILWGIFKKIVIADSCANYANDIFAHSSHYAGSTLLLGAFFFAIQIYGDFSGYSDIAIGTAKLFSIRLSQNFANPYFATNIADFWRRWHISLTQWFRDYVYIPLGGNRGTSWQRIANILIVFLLSGLWHGANWTFIAWGALHALLFLPLIFWRYGQSPLVKQSKSTMLWQGLQIIFTFSLTTLAWIFFRAEDISQALNYYQGIVTHEFMTKTSLVHLTHNSRNILIVIVFAVEWWQRKQAHALDFSQTRLPWYFRWGIYYGLILAIAVLRSSAKTFIYFQF